MGLFSSLKKKLKKTTRILDPVGHQLRKSTGGSYGDPMNWYNSKPNQTQPYQRPPSPGLMPQPGGPAPTGHNFGSNTGGRTYTPNPFAGGVAPQGGGPPGVMGKSGPSPLPAGPMKNPMSFGGQTAFGSQRPPNIDPARQRMVGRVFNPLQQQMQGSAPQPQQTAFGSPRPQNIGGWAGGPRMGAGGPNMQMLQAQLLRGKIA